MAKSNQKKLMRLGLWVFLTLMVVEIVEYMVGVSLTRGAWPFLAILAVPGAGFILYYFMHIQQLWRREE